MNRGWKYADGKIVELEILGINNEDRWGVCDPDRAKFRCSAAKVLSIVDRENGKPYKCAVSSGKYGNRIRTRYNVGQMVYPDMYTLNSDCVCGHGIHYFKTRDAAVRYPSSWVISDCGCMTYNHPSLTSIFSWPRSSPANAYTMRRAMRITLTCLFAVALSWLVQVLEIVE